MYIKKIRVAGFRSLSEFTIDGFRNGLNVLIGENNVGKSNILKAMNTFFNKSNLDTTDLPKSYLPIMKPGGSLQKYHIDITFAEVVPGAMGDMIKYAKNGEVTIRARFDDNYLKQYALVLNEESQTSVNPNFLKALPHYVYIGDLSEKVFDIDALAKLYPITSIEQKTKIETLANQFARGLRDKNTTLSITPLEIEEGTYEINIIDEYGNSDLFINKSSGIQQISYLSMFFAVNAYNGNSNVILAIEEPEANLHTRAQKEMFKFIKDLCSGPLPVFLSTHSPIFIDQTQPESVFHIKRNRQFQTVAENTGYKSNWSTIRQDLGLEISDSLFLGDLNIIVEGPTEKIVFPKVIEVLNQKGVIRLKPTDVNIISAAGVDNTYYYVKLVCETGLKTVVIVDNDQAGRNAKKRIENDANLKDLVKVLVLERPGLDESEVEDLFGDSVLLDAINDIYSKKFTLEELETARENPNHKEKIDKFSETVKRLGLDNAVDKLMIAQKVKNALTTKSDLSGLDKYFQLIDKILVG